MARGAQRGNAARRRAAIGAAGAVLWCVAGIPALALEPERDFDALTRARFIHCAFFRAEPLAERDAAPPERKAEVLLHYQSDGRSQDRWRVISTRASGARDIRVVRTERAVHFIDRLSGMYSVTTVFGCNARDRRAAHRPCVTYGAIHALHFDASVYHQPDRVFDALKPSASHGFCDHSFAGIE
jgi:hypothetical protein